ncbi:MAG: hypothetical protein RL148_1281 [Planctomycetota bacterium]|jgi:zinc protease
MLPKVETLLLQNGMRVLLLPRHSLPVVATVLWYEVGARDELSGETGVSHFLEHMMFKGTDRYAKGQIDLLTSKMGGSNNAFTDNDGTAYFFAMASDRWEPALEIEASRMRSCLLDPTEFTSEKSVVLEELAMGEDEPWRPLYQATESLLFQVHPYHHPVIGWKQDLERLTVAGMRAYYDRNYGPNRAFLVIAGDIDVERTKQRVTELFGSIPASAEARREVLAEPPMQGERRAVLNTPHSVKRMCIGFRGTRNGERDDYALDVLCHHLGLGKNSLLYKRLVVEEELVTNLSVMNEARLDPGAVFLLFELRDGADPEVVERMACEEVRRLVEKGVDKKDLARIREQIRAAFLFEDETVLDTALKVARFESMKPGGWQALEHVVPTITSLDNKELVEVAARHFDLDRKCVVWSVPAPTPAPAKARKPKAGKKQKPVPVGSRISKSAKGAARTARRARKGEK